MRCLIAVALTIGVIDAGSLVAQSAPPPSFAGSWVQETEPAAVPGRVPICASHCVITQSGESITVSDGMHNNSYKADGKPQVSIATTPTLTARITTTANWDGATLVITVATVSADLNAGKPFTTSSRLSLADGHLVIEGVRAASDGSEAKYHGSYRRDSVK